MPKISVHDLMTISWVLLLIIGLNDLNTKLLQPIVVSICKVMTVKKPCVLKFDRKTYKQIVILINKRFYLVRMLSKFSLKMKMIAPPPRGQTTTKKD